jgi:Anaphase-promoting complex, cyclosome, subunit 4
MDESFGEGESGNSQAVDIVCVGSDTGHVELRHPDLLIAALTISVFGTFSLTAMNTKYSQSHKLIVPLHHCTTPDLALHAILGKSTSSTALHLNFFLNNTLHSHGLTLRQLTSLSTTLNALLAYLEETWSAIPDEWTEVEKVRRDVVSKLTEYLDEDPERIPRWWTNENKQDASSALLCLLMTGASEPEVVQWFAEKFGTVV